MPSSFPLLLLRTLPTRLLPEPASSYLLLVFSGYLSKLPSLLYPMSVVLSHTQQPPFRSNLYPLLPHSKSILMFADSFDKCWKTSAHCYIKGYPQTYSL